MGHPFHSNAVLLAASLEPADRLLGPDAGDGKPHLVYGMVLPVTVS